MLWSPNSMFGSSIDDVHGGYTPYWPGQQYVDLVGMSLYSTGGPQRLNILPAENQAINALRVLDGVRRFSSGHEPLLTRSQLYGTPLGLPLVVSETAAAYTYDPTTGEALRGGADEHDMKLNWLQQLTDGTLKAAVPSLISINWVRPARDRLYRPADEGSQFEIVKDESAGPHHTQMHTEDFRLLLSVPDLSQSAVSFFTIAEERNGTTPVPSIRPSIVL